MGSTKTLPPATANVAEATKALSTYLPAIAQSGRNELLPDALAQFGATSAVAPGYANLQTDLFDTSGRKLAQIGDEIQNATAANTLARDTALTQNSGSLLSFLQQGQQFLDPEYYGTRSTVANSLGQRINNGLTGSEQTEIERGLNRQNQSQGTLDIPSSTTTTKNALTYGKAGQDSLTQALQQANNFLGVTKPTTDVFQVATGKSSTPSAGLGMFNGTQQAQPSALAGNVFGGALNSQNQSNALNAGQTSQTDKIWGMANSAAGQVLGAY